MNNGMTLLTDLSSSTMKSPQTMPFIPALLLLPLMAPLPTLAPPRGGGGIFIATEK